MAQTVKNLPAVQETWGFNRGLLVQIRLLLPLCQERYSSKDSKFLQSKKETLRQVSELQTFYHGRNFFLKWKSLSNCSLRTFSHLWLGTRGQGSMLKMLKVRRVASTTEKYFPYSIS